uniref:Group 1 truncated hemoglobin n=1 Tax=Panagrellus redivivus TaxID=6233 RepID=A0A7E4VL54_PANRE
MQTRSLFAVLILGFAVGIAFAETDDVDWLEQLSPENVVHVAMETFRSVLNKADPESQKKAKLEVASYLPHYPGLKNSVDLSTNQFCDLVLETVLAALSEQSSSEQEAEKQKFLDLIKKFDKEVEVILKSLE